MAFAFQTIQAARQNGTTVQVVEIDLSLEKETAMVTAKDLFEKATKDSALLACLKADPLATLKTLMEQSEEELSDEQLAKVAGGGVAEPSSRPTH